MPRSIKAPGKTIKRLPSLTGTRPEAASAARRPGQTTAAGRGRTVDYGHLNKHSPGHPIRMVVQYARDVRGRLARGGSKAWRGTGGGDEKIPINA